MEQYGGTELIIKNKFPGERRRVELEPVAREDGGAFGERVIQ